MADGEPASREPKRILVGEDDDAMRAVIVETLTEAGYDVRGVGDGAALLVELARHDRFHYRRVDLVLSDLRMPHCSGMQVFDAMAGARVLPKLALMTAFPDEATVQAARLRDVFVIPKPVRMGQLVGIVAEILGESTLPSR